MWFRIVNGGTAQSQIRFRFCLTLPSIPFYGQLQLQLQLPIFPYSTLPCRVIIRLRRFTSIFESLHYTATVLQHFSITALQYNSIAGVSKSPRSSYNITAYHAFFCPSADWKSVDVFTSFLSVSKPDIPNNTANAYHSSISTYLIIHKTKFYHIIQCCYQFPFTGKYQTLNLVSFTFTAL